MKTLRIDHVTVATPDAPAAQATFRTLFGFGEVGTASPERRSLRVGGARIAFVTPAAGSDLATVLAAGGEGMVELCLEVEDLAAAEATLAHAGVAVSREESEGAASLRVNPSACHGVRLRLQSRS